MTLPDITHYTYRVTWSAEDGEFVGTCLEFPSPSWLAATQDEALHGIRDVVRDVVKDLHASGAPIPEPLSSRTYSGKFNLRVGEQSIESFDVAPSLKLQYVFTPRFGVVIPYLVGRYHFELSDDARVISAQYADALGQLFDVPGTDFAVSTDIPDDEYYTLAGGFSFVLPHGFNGFVQYLEVLDLEAYTDSVITAGFRFEF